MITCSNNIKNMGGKKKFYENVYFYSSEFKSRYNKGKYVLFVCFVFICIYRYFLPKENIFVSNKWSSCNFIYDE